MGQQETIATVELRQLLTFTEIQISRSRQLARSGKKDEARDWLRFFSNARLLQILGSASFVSASDLDKLRSDLKQLNSECHPLDVPDHRTDLQEILGKVEQVLHRQELLAGQLAKLVPVTDSPVEGSEILPLFPPSAVTPSKAETEGLAARSAAGPYV